MVLRRAVTAPLLCAALCASGLAGTLAGVLPASAQSAGGVTLLEGVVVTTPDRGATTLGATGNAVTVIGPEQIAASNEATVAGLLKAEPGLTVAQSGGPGGVVDVRIRGAETNHTLVMIDGVRVSDPTSSGGEFDFALFSLANVERVEIVRGPQSGVYGSEAIGGVINIITKAGSGPPKGFAELSGGSYGTFTQRVGVSGSSGPLGYSIGAANTRSSGFSRLATGTEPDASSKQALTGRFDYAVAPNFKITTRLGAYHLDAELDTTTRDRLFDRTRRTLLDGAVTGQLDLFGGAMRNTLTLYGNATDRLFYAQQGSLASTNFLTSRFEGYRAGAELQSDFKVRDVDRLTLGGKVEQEAATARDITSAGVTTGRFDADHINSAAFALYSFNPVKAFTLTAAGRIDRFGDIGTEATYRLSAAYTFAETGTKLRASYGTGAKAPTIFQRLETSTQFGLTTLPNPGLLVETSTGFDVGIDQTLLDGRLKVSATYFDNDITNLIEFTFLTPTTGQYRNLAAARTRGIETSADFKISDAILVGASYTWLDATDAATGLKLRRRPEHTAKASLTLLPFAGAQIAAHLVYQSTHFNRAAEVDPVSGFTRLDLTGSYDLDANVTIFARMENVADVSYQEVRSFATPGRSAYAGLRWRF